MSSRQHPKQLPAGATGTSKSAVSKEPPKKQQPEKKPSTGRLTSTDRGVPSARGGATSLPASPHNPRLTPGQKKPASSVTPKKDVAVKAKVETPVQKEPAVAEVADDPEIEVLGAVGGEIGAVGGEAPFRRLPSGVETGQFTRRTPAEVIRPIAFRPKLSPRSKKVHESACKFMAVKREETNDQKRMETFIMEMFPKLQQTLTRVEELSVKAKMFRPKANPGSDQAVKEENDTLNFQIALAAKIFRDFDILLAETKNRALDFICRAEKGTQDIDAALKEVINDICNYSKNLQDQEGVAFGRGRPDDDDGNDQGGRPGHGHDGMPDDGKPGEGAGGKPDDDKPGSGGKPDDGKPGAGSGGHQGGKPGDDGKPGGGSGGDQEDGSGDDNQGGKPGGPADDGNKPTDDLEFDEYDSLISPSASESEPEFEEDIHKYCEIDDMRVNDDFGPTLVKVGELAKAAIEDPDKVPEVFKEFRKVTQSSADQFKDIFKSGVASKLVDCISGLDEESPEKAFNTMFMKLFYALGYRRNPEEFEGIEDLMNVVAAEVPKDTQLKPTVITDDDPLD